MTDSAPSVEELLRRAHKNAETLRTEYRIAPPNQETKPASVLGTAIRCDLGRAIDAHQAERERVLIWVHGIIGRHAEDCARWNYGADLPCDCNHPDQKAKRAIIDILEDGK